MKFELMQGDCLELLADIPDGSIDLVLTDPPYGVMSKSTHDVKGWKKRNIKWDSEIMPKDIFPLIAKKLRVNGRCALFSQEPYTSKLVQSAIPIMPFSYRAVWVKNNAGVVLGCKKNMVSYFEDICIFSKSEFDYNHENPARNYLMSEKVKSGITDWKKILGNQMAGHYFTNGFQFSIPSEENYKKLQSTGFFTRDYSELVKENEEYKSSVPKSVFNLWQGKEQKSNVLEYSRDTGGYHPTQKPVALLEDLIQTYSNLGDTVLDFTMGSGSTGVACVNTDRDFIGIELDQSYFEIAEKRIEEAKSKAGGLNEPDS